MIDSYYRAGTLSVTAGSTAVVLVGAAALSQVKAGDQLVISGTVAVIDSVTDNLNLVLADGWPGATVAGSADYLILRTGAAWSTTVVANAQLAAIIAAIEAGLQVSGALAIPYTFSTTTTDADPGVGNLRLGSATQNAATVLRADLVDARGAGVAGLLDDLAASNSGIKSRIRIFKTTDPTKWLVANVTAMASPSGYRNFTIAPVGASSASPFTDGDAVTLIGTPNGDMGSVPDGSITFAKLAANAGREVLTANRTYYVRADGSDSNNGLANTSGGAFLTLQKAWSAVLAIDLAGRAVTIKVADGTYTAGLSMSAVPVGGLVTIEGNTTIPANCLISTTGATCFNASFGGTLTIRGFKVQTTTSGSGINASNFTRVDFSDMDFGSCATNHISALAYGYATATGDYSISGGGVRHMNASSFGSIQGSNRTITLAGTPAFSSAFAYCDRQSLLLVTGATFPGTGATGQRYNVQTNGIILCGAVATYFPGSTAGAVATGGQYLRRNISPPTGIGLPARTRTASGPARRQRMSVHYRRARVLPASATKRSLRGY